MSQSGVGLSVGHAPNLANDMVLTVISFRLRSSLTQTSCLAQAGEPPQEQILFENTAKEMFIIRRNPVRLPVSHRECWNKWAEEELLSGGRHEPHAQTYLHAPYTAWQWNSLSP